MSDLPTAPQARAPLPREVGASTAARDIADRNWAQIRDHRFSRGRFLSLGLLGGGGVLGVGILGLAVATFISPLRRKDVTSDRVELGDAASFPLGAYVKQRLAYRASGGADYIQVTPRAAYVRRNPDGFVDRLTGRRDRFTVLWDRCAHLGCPVAYEGTEFVCPCHGGVYDDNGRRIAGPPLHSLDRFAYQVESGRLVLYGPYSLYPTGRRSSGGDRLYAPGKLRNPGEATQGFEGAWYPLQNGEDT